ncbi:MAG: beta-eliminating lyase-related protein [Microbacteriaceae bacterium]|jgi:threonine aldolase|nr:beta-eliminating lyase-related protein [Microbacteriaceae bacterium]MCI1206740.1 beta-eliminating lyase-related protein [Microbacteriaceae bacterium]
MVEISPKTERLTFASDNYAPAHPTVLSALAEASSGRAAAYGEDPWTARLRSRLETEFGEGTQSFPVFTGTGANTVALTALVPRFGGVLAADTAHANTEESAAAAALGGIRVLPVPSTDGKLTPESLELGVSRARPVHSALPAAVTVSTPTELGTCYSVQELRELTTAAHRLGLAVHLDGARIWNAAAAAGITLGGLLRGSGVDLLSLGGTKVGGMGAEVVVAGPDAPTARLEIIRKTATQLASKMRYLSAQLLALFDDDLGIRLADRSNRAATELRRRLSDIPTLEWPWPVQANSLFPRLSAACAAGIRACGYHFYDWDTQGTVRWMCPWDITDDEVADFAATIHRCAAVGQ